MIKEKAVEIIKQLLIDEEEQGDIFFDNEDKTALKFAIKVLSAPAVPQITVFTESTDEKAIADLKAELQSVLDSDSRPEGEWINPQDCVCYQCSNCKEYTNNEGTIKEGLFDYCPKCGAKMRNGGTETKNPRTRI